MLSFLLEIKKNFPLIILIMFPIINYINKTILQQTITSTLRSVDQETLTVLLVICFDRQMKMMTPPTIVQCNDIIDENRVFASDDGMVMNDVQLLMGSWKMKFKETFISVDVLNFAGCD